MNVSLLLIYLMMCHYFLSHDVSLILIYMYLVVERERMGTAFPHKKLSGNGVPTCKRNFERYLFVIAIKFAISH